MVEPGESLIAAATRELYEETGLVATEADMRSLGVHAYLRDKDLALFAWQRPQLPEPDTLICESTFMLPGGAIVPEFDRFGLFTWDDAFGKVGKNLARVLANVRESATRLDAVTPSRTS
jgi:8-oxo-dGTP pyrophosphatase MutT (NUDIX family)